MIPVQQHLQQMIGVSSAEETAPPPPPSKRTSMTSTSPPSPLMTLERFKPQPPETSNSYLFALVNGRCGDQVSKIIGPVVDVIRSTAKVVEVMVSVSALAAVAAVVT